MSILDRKLLRNLRELKGQVVAIVLIVACGVASLVTVLTAYRGLRDSKEAYYARYRMAGLFAPVKRAPRSVARDLEKIPGVRRVEGRIVFEVTLDLETLDQPCTARILSVPERRRKILNDLHLVSGRWFEGEGTREVIVAERFAREHGLTVGDEIRAVMNNNKEALRIIGTALSPEFVYLIRGADIIPDARHFTVLWVSQSFAEAVFDFEDAANDFVASLDRTAPVDSVIDAFDARLDRYGALGAFARKDQVSNRYVSDEIEGLRASATMAPSIFLGVAAFVLHMMMGRLVRTQRTQIAVLRAFGYGTLAVAGHYVKLALLVGALGAALGSGLGLWFARGLLGIYQDFFNFPILHFDADPAILVIGFGVSLLFAALGAVDAVRHVVRLAPAEGMRPEAPHVYKRTLLERARVLWRRMGFAARMVARDIARTKLRAAVTVVGVALSASIVMLAFFGRDSIDELIDFQFRLTERQDVRVVFRDERGRAALHEIRRLDGVLWAEPELGVPVRFVHGTRSRRAAITGLERGFTLHALLDRKRRHVPLPRYGLLLSRKLADLLDVGAGDEIEVRVLTGKKQRFLAPVENVVEEYLGTFAYADLYTLSRWVDEEAALSGAVLSVDPRRATALGRELKDLPGVAGVAFRAQTVKSFRDTIAESQGIQTTILILFAGVITFGVVYNAARISLAERQRELGSLRVLGFTHGEVATVLVSENLCLVLAALLPGVALGTAFCWLLTRIYDTDLYRFPFVLSPQTILWTVVSVVGFAILANILVARRLGRLDLVEILKERD